ncbi:unnamed protein product [Closterium sp. Naga37s-1]|nr:unnamed protein product [Closterium sp. Naga37s-1]
MGLFGDLPPPSNAPKPPTRANPPSSTSTPSSKPSTPAERPAAVAPKPSALKSSLKGRADARGEEGTGNVSAGGAGGGSGDGGKTRKRVGMAVADEADGDAPPRRRVRFNTFAEVAEDKVTSAIAKIAAHIGTPTKFKKAAGLARQLLEGGALNSAANSVVNSGVNRSVESGHAGLFFGVLEAAMGLLRREGGGAGGMVVGAAGDVGSDYAALIGAAVERKELFTPWQQQQVDVWGLRAVLTHSLRTDDSFQVDVWGHEGRWTCGGMKAGGRVGAVRCALTHSLRTDDSFQAGVKARDGTFQLGSGTDVGGADGGADEGVGWGVRWGALGMKAGGDSFELRGATGGGTGRFSKAVSRVQQEVERLPEAAEEDGRDTMGVALSTFHVCGFPLFSPCPHHPLQFSKAVSRVQQEVERLAEAAEEDEREEAGLFAGVAMQMQGREGHVEGEGEGERRDEKGEGKEEESVERQGSKLQENRDGGEEGGEERREEKGRDDANATDVAADTGADADADPFGLNSMLGLSGEKGGGKGGEGEEEEEEEEEDPFGAQTAIDMLTQHAHDHRRRFTGRQRAAIEALWTSVRQQQHERKHGAGRGGTGRLDVTAFERLQRHYEGEAISIRKGVGGGGDRSTITWLG